MGSYLGRSFSHEQGWKVEEGLLHIRPLINPLRKQTEPFQLDGSPSLAVFRWITKRFVENHRLNAITARSKTKPTRFLPDVNRSLMMSSSSMEIYANHPCTRRRPSRRNFVHVEKRSSANLLAFPSADDKLWIDNVLVELVRWYIYNMEKLEIEIVKIRVLQFEAEEKRR